MRYRKAAGLTAAVLSILILSGCSGGGGSGGDYSGMKNDVSSGYGISMDSAGADYAQDDYSNNVSGDYNGNEYESKQEPDSASDKDLSKKNENELKLIYTYDYSVEVTDLAEQEKQLEERVYSAGGYVESLDVYNYSGSTHASCDITIRVPAEKADALIDFLDSETNITSMGKNVDNATEEYIDIESRVGVYRTEQKRLQEMLAEADTIDTMLTLQQRLTQVTADIESYESRLRNIDKLVSYSTLNVHMSEVEKETSLAEKNEGMFAEIWRKLKDNVYILAKTVRAFIVWLVSSMPLLIPILLIVFVVLKIAKKLEEKKRKRKEETIARIQKEQEARRNRGSTELAVTDKTE